VAVELCNGRYQSLKGKEDIKAVNIKELLSGGKFYYLLVQVLLTYAQKKIGTDQGVKPGTEMLSAIEKAEKNGVRVALIDRDIHVTLERFWSKMSFFEKLKLFVSLVGTSLGFGTKEIDINAIMNDDVVTQLVSGLRKFAPNAAFVLVDERNAIMAKNLLDISKEGKVVAVVGAAHCEGIRKYLDNPESIPPTGELMRLPKKGFSWFNAAAVAVIAMVAGLMALLLYQDKVSLAELLTALLYLFIAQGALSAIGVLLARGHPLSALTAFSLAWVGFLHPFLAIGWLAGIVEAHFHPPTTEDFKTIAKAETMRELMHNRLFRIILVAGLANIGSIVGTFVAIPVMVHYLGIPNPLEMLETALSTGLNLVKNLL
jgi:pheromone shutdown-related protein TraB